MRRMILWLPLALFALLVVMVALNLYAPTDTVIRSRLVGKPIPAFALPAGVAGKPGLDSAGLKQGQPRLLNIFASWCVPCAAEAPQLMELARRGIPIDAIAIRDRPEDIAGFLRRYGDPYRSIGSDRNSSVQVALGSSGVPETFLVDGKGIIRLQHIGDIRAEDVDSIVAAYKAAAR